MRFGFGGLICGRDAVAQVELQGAFGTDRDTAATVGALTRADQAGLGGLSEIQHLGFRANAGTFSTVGAGRCIESHPQRREPADHCIKGAQRTEMTAPAMFQYKEVEQEYAQYGSPAQPWICASEQ